MITLFKRKSILFLLIVIVFIVILGSSYLFILNGQPFKDYLKPIIIKQLENNLGKSVHIEEILRSLFTKATEDTIETLSYTIQVFQDPYTI